MFPGYLHFNLSGGCTAEMLNAAMAQILKDATQVRGIFTLMSMPEIRVEVSEDANRGILGSAINFYAHDKKIAAEMASRKAAKPPRDKTKPRWDGVPALPLEVSDVREVVKLSQHEFVHRCLMGETIGLRSIRDIYLSKKVPQGLSALAIKILENLISPIFIEQKLAGPEALWLFCQLTMLCAQVEALDPKFISATKISVGVHAAVADKEMHFDDPRWLNQLLKNLPCIETDVPVHVDVLALAFLKTLVGRFGPRGESTIVDVGFGLPSKIDLHYPGMVEALWCEPALPKTMTELSTTRGPACSRMMEVSGFVALHLDMRKLAMELTQHGAKSVHFSHVFNEKNHTENRVTFLVNESGAREAVEAFLVKGFADHVRVNATEYHALSRREVVVPLGFGNKQDAAQLLEYLYYDKIVRVEPSLEDVVNYAHDRNISVDVARSDILMAWKKWRARPVVE